MPKTFFLICFIGLLTPQLSAQKKLTEQDLIFEKYCKDLRQFKTNFTTNELMQKSDSLYKNASTNFQKINALIVQVDVYSSKNENKIALQKAKEAEKLAQSEQLINKEIYLKILISSIYRIADLNYNAIENLREAKILNEKDPKNEKYISNKVKINIELGDNYSFLNDYTKAKSLLNEAKLLLESQDKIDFDYLDVLIVLGDLNNRTYSFDETFKIAKKITQINQEFKNSHVEMLVEIMYGEAYLAKGNYKTALLHFKKAEYIIDKYDYESDQYMVNKLLADTYIKLDDSITFQKTEKKLSKINENNAVKKNDFIQEVSNAEISVFNALKKWINTLYLLSIILIVLISSLLIYIKKSRKSQRKLFERLVKQYNSEINELKCTENQQQEPLIKSASTLVLNENTELFLLKKLEDFEARNGFTNRKLTIAALAYELETNTKYLTLLLKKHRNLNFKDYLNSNRINYITKRLIEEPELLKYKITHFADLAGFSSHSHFTSVFKKHTKLSPSSFIKQLQQKQLESNQ